MAEQSGLYKPKNNITTRCNTCFKPNGNNKEHIILRIIIVIPFFRDGWAPKSREWMDRWVEGGKGAASGEKKAKIFVNFQSLRAFPSRPLVAHLSALHSCVHFLDDDYWRWCCSFSFATIMSWMEVYRILFAFTASHYYSGILISVFSSSFMRNGTSI